MVNSHGHEGLRSPRTLTLAITGACNLQCLHCWVEAGVPSSAGHVPEQTLYRMVSEFADLGGTGIRFTGGEPLCHPSWLGLMQFSRKLGFSTISLQTNGMLLTDGAVAALGELDFPGLSIQISLDGATAATHDLVRGQGAFRDVLHGIRLLARAGLGQRVTLFFTEMRHNLDDIPAVLELAAGLGIASVTTGTLVPAGRSAEGTGVAPPSPEQYLRLCRRYDVERRFRELHEGIGNVAALKWRAAAPARRECCTFVENPYLTPVGRLYPCVLCHSDDYSVSGVHGKRLADAFAEGASLWSALLRVSLCRADALEQCRECPERRSCAGGCMGRAVGSCGDPMAADDRCGIRQAIYRHRAAHDNGNPIPLCPSSPAGRVLEGQRVNAGRKKTFSHKPAANGAKTQRTGLQA